MVVTRLGIFTLFLFICPTCIASASNTTTWTLTVTGDVTSKNVTTARMEYFHGTEQQKAYCAIFNGKVRMVTCEKTKLNDSFAPLNISISYTVDTNDILTTTTTTTSSPAVTAPITTSSTEIEKTDEAGIILVTAVLLLATAIMINVTGCWCKTKVLHRMNLNKSPKPATNAVKKVAKRRNMISASSFQGGRRAAAALPQPPMSVPSRVESAIYEEINF